METLLSSIILTLIKGSVICEYHLSTLYAYSKCLECVYQIIKQCQGLLGLDWN